MAAQQAPMSDLPPHGCGQNLTDGALEKNTTAMVPTDKSAMATQTPRLSRPSNTTSRTSMMTGSDIYSCSMFSRTGARVMIVATNRSMKAIVSINNPAEVANCGIHNGMAIMPLERSP